MLFVFIRGCEYVRRKLLSDLFIHHLWTDILKPYSWRHSFCICAVREASLRLRPEVSPLTRASSQSYDLFLWFRAWQHWCPGLLVYWERWQRIYWYKGTENRRAARKRAHTNTQTCLCIYSWSAHVKFQTQKKPFARTWYSRGRYFHTRNEWENQRKQAWFLRFYPLYDLFLVMFSE